MASRGSIFDRVKDDDKKTKRKSLTFTDVEAPNAPKSFVTEPPAAPTIHRDLTDIQTDLTAAKRERSGLLNDFGFNAPDLSEFRVDLNMANSNVNRYKSENLIEDKVYQSGVKQDTFVDQFSASKTMGRLTQNQSRAWNEYLKNSTPENRRIAQSYDKAIEDYAKKNKIALDDQNVKLGIISQSYANYLPQQIDQLKAQAPGAIIGGAAGLVVGQPHIGAKIGASISSGADMFEITRGAAFKRLLDMGVDEETARALAADEGIVQGIIEGGDTYLDWTLFGGKALATKLLPSLSAKASTAAGKSALAKVIKQLGGKIDNLPTGAKVLGAYGVNVPQEGLEEGLQEVVSIANDRRVETGETGVWNLLENSLGLGKDLLAGTDYVVGYDQNGKPIMASEQIKESAKEGMKIAVVSGGMQALGGYAAQRALTPKPAKVDNKNTPAPVSPAASPEVQQVQAQAEVTQAQNPEAEVLDAATTLFTQQGMNLKTAQTRAEIVGKLIRGEEVSDKDLNRLDPTSNQTKQIFTQLTGVQFPEGKIQIEQLRNIYRSAHEVAQVAKTPIAEAAATTVAENATVESQLTDEQILERAKEARTRANPDADKKAAQILAQTRGEIAPDGNALLSFKDFRAWHQQKVPDATREESARLYDMYLTDNQTLLYRGQRVSKRQFMETLKNAPGGQALTQSEMEQLWRDEMELQKQDGKDATEHSVRNKEANNGRTNSVHSERLSGQPDQRSGGQSRGVSEATGRAEGDGGARRGDQGGSQAGRSSQERTDGQTQAGQGAYRVTEIKGYPVTEVLPHAYTPEMNAIADRYNGTGVNVHFIAEGYPIDDAGNHADGITIKRADGTRDVYLQIVAGKPLIQRSEHELGHVAIMDDPALKERAIVALANAVSEEDLTRLVNAYLPMYGNAYANNADLIGDLLEEIICDAYANLNRAGAGAPEYHDAVSGVIEAHIQTYSASYGQEVTLTDDAGNLVVETDDQGHSRFSMSTYDESGRDILTQWMGRAVVNGDLTSQDADDIIKTMDLIYDICKEARESGEYAPFDAWSEAKVVVNEKGEPVFSVVKANGDYAMNLDFSLVCKKRRTLDAVLNELVRRGFVDNLALNEKQIVKINELIRSYGFETACDLCFVDAKRYRQGKVADDFVKLYNDLVLSMVPKNSGLQPQYFNFGSSTLVTNDGAGIHELPDAELDFTKIDKVLATKGEKTVEYKTAMLLKNSPADRKLTMRGDFLSTRGFDAINRENPGVLKLFNAKKGSGGPKSAVSDVQYLNEVLTSKTFTPEKAYAVGGVRIQSFSDYVPRMVFDYVQMIADLAAKKLPAHSYTKEELYVKQFGLTGMKINMSLIPKVVDGGIAPGLDADGNYAWADESFDFEEAKKIQNAEGYSRNCGTIAVGVSDEHIRTLMSDPDIRMVIPYHKSGLSPIVAKMNKIDQFVNYTDFQNTRRPNGKHGKKLSKDVAADKKLLDEMPDFNTRMRELGDPRAAAEEYVRWCEEHDLLPKFDQFAYKQIDGVVVEKDGQRVVDENYYKLLEDFTVYDNGEYTPQTGLTMTFPNEDSAFGSMKDLIKRGLEEDAVLEGKRTEKVPEIVGEIMKFSAGYWKPNLDNTEWSIVKSVMNNGRGINLTASSKMFLERTKGKTVFGIYSTDDDTLLYASRGEEAMKEHQFVEFVKEAFDNGQLTDTSTKGLRDFIKATRVQSVGNAGNLSTNGGPAQSGGYAGVHIGQPQFNASRALENVLTNLLKAEESRRANSVTEQPTQASEKSGAFNLDDYTIDEILKWSDADFERAYDALGLGGIDDDILLEDDFDFVDVAEELDEEPEKIEILFRRKGLGSDYVAPEKQAVMTEKRIDERIAEHGAGNNAGYARRYITRISPKDFIDLTVHERNTDRETFDTRVTGDIGSTMKDWDYGKQLTESREPPVLDLNLDNGQVIGHNGRHRVRALEMAGIESVEIEVELYQDGYLKKLGAKTIPDLAISSQFDTKIETHLPNLIPLNKAHRDEIMQNYGEKAHADAAVKYSIVDSTGQLLTEDQQKYFKRSKVRDHLGRLKRMYHGTSAFGFTVFDPEFSDDGVSLFFTDDPTVANSYIHMVQNADTVALDRNTDMSQFEGMTDFETAEAAWEYLEKRGYRKLLDGKLFTPEQLKSNLDGTAEIVAEEAREWLAVIDDLFTRAKRTNNPYLKRLSETVTSLDTIRGDSTAQNLEVLTRISEVLEVEQDLLETLEFFQYNYPSTFNWDEVEGIKDMISDPESTRVKLMRLQDALEVNEPAYLIMNPREGIYHMPEANFIDEARDEAERAMNGMYEVYLNLENPLIVRAFGSNWNDLDYDDIAEHDRYGDNDVRWEGSDTREIAEWAKANNYDGVIFRDLIDVGGFDYTESAHDSTIVIAFKSEQVKSTANEHPTKDPDIRYSITPQFEQWYKETYGTELTSAQLKRRLQTAERRAAEAEHDKKAAELKNIIDSEMDLTAWMIHHTKKMREQKRVMNTKLAEARKAKTEAVRTAVAETKEIERAKAEVQHDADRMAERRNAAKRLRTQENAYTNKVTEMKENAKLKRNAAKATLRDSRLAAKKRAAIETEQGLVDTIRKNPKQRTGVEKLQDAAQQLRTLGRSAYRNFVNMAESVDRFSKRQVSDMRAGTLVNILGGSASTMEAVFKKGLVDRAGNRIGESMSDVFLCWDEAHKKVNEGQQALLQDFMLHWHNIDRMSIVARAESALETFELNNEWLRDMDQKEFARLVAMTEKEVEKLGKYEAQQQAFEYVRLIRAYNEAQNKPIFADDKGNSVTAETSQRIVDQYLAEQPWLLDKANGIYEWWDLFMRNWAVGDTISEAEYSRMRQMYPHYVPTYRADKNGVGGAGFVGAGGATVSKAVKKAKGSHSEVMNIEDSFSNIVSKIIRLNRLNELYMNIIDTAMLDEDGTFADMAYFDWDWQDGAYANALLTGSADIADLTDTVEETEKACLEKVGSDYKLTGWLNGRKYTAYISEDLYKSIGMVTGHLANDLEQNLLKAGNTLTTPMKTAITGINPTFAIRNLSRDLPTAIINSISGLNFPKYYAQAAKEIAKNSDHWKTFQALGGTHATYYNDNKGFVKDMTGKHPVKKVLGALGSFNEVTEAQTRFAEYLATVDKLGDTYEARLQGIKNAAEVTVDFSRKGRYGKVINAWVPYWNPAVQGIDKTVRSVIDSPDGSAVWKQASKTLGRAAMTTILFEAILYGVLKALDRDDEWEELNDRTKDTYYCIPLKDSNRFLKIPKNREWGAILGTPFMRMLEWANGREDPFENYIETAIEPNFLPPAIFRPDSGGGFATDAIGISQALDLAKNEDFAGRTIVPYSYQQGTLSQQYDSETSWVAKKLGQLFNWSPMQIDYILSDYFGDIGEMILQASSDAVRKGDQNGVENVLDIVTSPFLADARYSNYAVSKYYDLMDDLGRVVQDKKNQMGTDAAKETLEYQTEKAIDEMYGKQISELNRIVRELPDGTEKDNAKAQIAQLTKEAIEFYNDSMAGKVSNPIRTAEYHDFSETVSKELIRMDAFSGDYKFVPYDVPKSKYNDPDDEKNREYILTDEQKDYFKQLYREKYNEIFEDLIQSSKYKKKKDSEKAELLEDARDDVLDATKEEFFEWLDDTGVRSTKKQK